MLVSNMLREIRMKIGLTQKEVAEKLHVSRTTYVQYETGKRSVSAEMFFAIMKVLEENFSLSSWNLEFLDAIEHGDLELVKKYTEQGIDLESLNELGERPFLRAIVNNQPEILSYLIEKGSPYDSVSDIEWKERHGQDKFFYSLTNGHLEIAKILLTHFELESEVNFAKGMGLGFLPLKSRLFIQFLDQIDNIQLEKLEELAKRLNMVDKEKLIKEHTSLALAIAERYKKEGRVTYLTDEELEKASIEGLRKATDKYDPDKGYKFSTYATWWIRQAIVRANVDKTGLPVHRYDYYKKFKEAYDEELKNTGKKLTKEEMAELFNVDLLLFKKIEDNYVGNVFWNE